MNLIHGKVFLFYKVVRLILNIFFIQLCFINSSYSQKEAINWTFGDDIGLNFNSTPPSAFNSEAFGGPPSTISDSAGNLLFYTGGYPDLDTIWNQNHQMMANGGDLITSDVSIILKQPGNNSIYYIFSISQSGNWQGDTLIYHIVDMSLQNGLGEVIQKNTFLKEPVATKLTAIRHCNNHDIWVIGHELYSDNFIAYKLSSTGLGTNPIISSIGTPHINWNNNNSPGRGPMKSSPNGKMIGLVLVQNSNFSNFEFYEFDNSSGIVTDTVAILNLFGMIGGCRFDFSPHSRFG